MLGSSDRTLDLQVFCALREWQDGTHRTLEFKDNIHRTVYEGFIDHLKALKQGAGRLKLAARCKEIARRGLWVMMLLVWLS